MCSTPILHTHTPYHIEEALLYRKYAFLYRKQAESDELKYPASPCLPLPPPASPCLPLPSVYCQFKEAILHSPYVHHLDVIMLTFFCNHSSKEFHSNHVYSLQMMFIIHYLKSLVFFISKLLDCIFRFPCQWFLFRVFTVLSKRIVPSKFPYPFHLYRKLNQQKLTAL